ncbi:MAG TPA: NAD-dependent epimerase/dehydratase family protein [Solirubrobacteraceae bacterium]|jgi:nucleoside-diphosphate-sugar epimerase
MRVLVTGASGNVGTSLLASLAREDAVDEIVGVARRRPSLTLPKVRWERADVAESELSGLFRGADAVVHLAWLIQPSRDESTTRRVNVDRSARVFEAVAQAGVPVLVYASSIGAYAPGPAGPPVDENWPVTGIPSSFYSRHKAAVERLLDDFELRHEEVRVVRLRPALCFKAGAATGIRRLFIGPLLPSPLLRREWLPVLPWPRGLRTQAVHSDDVGDAYRLAVMRDVRGAFNIAADPVLDASSVAAALGARPVQIPARLVRAAAEASWRLRLQPTSPDWLDLGMRTPLMDTSRARTELGFSPRHSALDAMLELLDGIRRSDGTPTPPLAPRTSGPARVRELLSGIGGTDRA